MLSALRRNLLLCAGALALFVSVHALFPGRNWPALVSTVAFITAVHLLWVATRNDVLPVIGSAAIRLRQWVWRR